MSAQLTRNDLIEFMRANPLTTATTISADGAPEAAIVGVAVSDTLGIVFDTIGTTCNFLM